MPYHRLAGFSIAIVSWALAVGPAHGQIISATHTATSGLSGTPLIQATPFNIGAVPILDRVHTIQRPNFDSNIASLSLGDVNGSNITALAFPSYLVGGQYVSVNQANRVAPGYQLTITTAAPSAVYLLLDNRSNGQNVTLPPAGSEYNDPDLINGLSWVVNDGWTRMNTGLTPGGQGDYLGIDESNNGNLNQFYAIFRKLTVGNSVTTFGLDQGVNMYSVVVVPVPEPSSLAFVGLSLGLAGLFRRRRAV